MIALWKHAWRAAIARSALLAAIVLPAIPAAAGTTEPPGGWPWARRPKIHGYDERPPATPPPTNVTHPPARYTITITVLPQMPGDPKEDPNVATVMAHLPEDAMLWFNDQPTRRRGTVRKFESPPLQAGKKYAYTVRAVWYEDGRWVSQTREVPVSPDAMSCIYLSKPSAIAAALAELSSEDRKLAERQRFCVVQSEAQLGSMGVPFKVMLKGQPVFLCCEDCADKARKDPDKALARLKELRAKGAKTSSK